MTLLFVNQHYHPDVASTGQHLTDLAEFLVAAGWDVEVICARGRYQSGRLCSPARETHNGVRIRRYWTPGFGRSSGVGRILEYLAFVTQALGRMVFGLRPTVSILLTTPPLLPALGALVRRLRGSPYGIWSMDLHPEAEVGLGLLRRDTALSRILFELADDGYRCADFVVVLGDCMRRMVLNKGVGADRIPLIHVWNRRDELAPLPRAANPLAAEVGIDDSNFVVMYSGNAGLAHLFEPFLEAAASLSSDPTISFVFVGDGPRRKYIEDFVKRRRLTNLRYLDYVERDRLSESLSIGDVHLASLRPALGGAVMPAKIYGAMAVERPILFLGPADCEPALTISEAQCGAVVDPRDDPHAAASIASILSRWAGDPDAVRRMGRRGREAFLEKHERIPCCRVFDSMLRDRYHQGARIQ